MTTKKVKYIGHGVYGIPEVSRYTRIHANTLRSWFWPRGESLERGLFTPDYPEIDGRYALSFLDMIEACVADQLREYGVSLHRIRWAHAMLRSEFSSPHPFAHTKFKTDGSRIFVLETDMEGEETLSEAITKQYETPIVINQFLQSVDYSELSSLAKRWRIASGVVVDPAVSLGKPVIEETGTTTFVVARSYFANNKDADLVADLFDLGPPQVLDAVAFEESHNSKLAA